MTWLHSCMAVDTAERHMHACAFAFQFSVIHGTPQKPLYTCSLASALALSNEQLRDAEITMLPLAVRNVPRLNDCWKPLQAVAIIVVPQFGMCVNQRIVEYCTLDAESPQLCVSTPATSRAHIFRNLAWSAVDNADVTDKHAWL